MDYTPKISLGLELLENKTFDLGQNLVDMSSRALCTKETFLRFRKLILFLENAGLGVGSQLECLLDIFRFLWGGCGCAVPIFDGLLLFRCGDGPTWDVG